MILPFRENQGRYLNLLFIIGVSVIILGLVAISGWYLHIGTLESVLPDYATMKFNTALCCITAGVCFLLLITYKHNFLKNLCRILAVCLGAFAFTSLFQSLFHWSAGIDQLFVTDQRSIKLGLPFPGRMSSSTAVCFTLMAASFLLIDANSKLYRIIAQYLLHTVTLIAFISVTGFILKVPNTLKFSFFSSMAINTSAAFILLSVAASSINYTLGINSLFTGKETGNIVARKLFPRMLVILIIIGYTSIELQRHNYISSEFGVVVSTIVFLLISLLLMSSIVTEMNILDRKRTEAENATQLLNRNLESIVHQRTLALEQSNERFLKIFNANPICVAMTRLDTGEYADMNPALLGLLQYTRDEVLGHTAAELSIISAEYRQRMVNSLSAKGYIKDEDIIIRNKNGEEKHCILSAELLETGHEKYMMTFVYDITNRKLLENSLQDAKKNLEILTDKLSNQNKQLLSFAHIISHNLRSPVSNLNLLIHFYKESTTQEDKDELWGNFETVTGHLNTTLDDLLETLKIQEDTAKEREELSFEQVFNTTHDILIGQIKKSGAVIKTDFSKAGYVVYPKIYLESIMLNLISNAIKYKSDKRTPEIIIESNCIDGETILTVQDNGLGIDLKRHAKNLFGLRKTFHRHTEAKGLGLFITKTQIEAMGGEITAESAVDVGTKFTVIFNKNQP